jgi:radical SAM superfamily enzyme YgiQ (UPF0313 family)
VGGYDASLAPEAYMAPDAGVDFIVRGEGELTFRELIRALERGTDLAGVAGLSFKDGDGFTHNPDRSVSSLDGGDVRLPNRSARVLRGYTMVGRQVDVVETSRGCTFDCSFCSIIEMRGRNFHTYDFGRVLDDIRDARAHGARAIFLVGRQHHAQRAAVRRPLPRHHRSRAQRSRLHGAGDDVGHRQSR